MSAPSELRELLSMRFISKFTIDNQNGCWEWQATKQNRGYGRYRNKLAHRFSYESIKGEIPKDMTIDHLCRNRLCVNPEHMEVVTQYENNMRSESVVAINRRKTHCVNGHKLSGDNIKIVYRKDGIRRKCKECQKIYKHRRKQNAK